MAVMILPRAVLELGTARLVGQRLTQRATGAPTMYGRKDEWKDKLFDE